MAVGTQTAITGAAEHLKCKLLSGTFKDAALRWYMNLPKNSIENYADFHKKFIHQFSGSKHIKVTTTSLFSIRQNYEEPLREYLARFSETTIKVSNPNQEMFVAAFHNGLRAGHFNESLAQKPASSMQEINKRAECYIKGEESNTEKRERDIREKDYANRKHKGQDNQPRRHWSQAESQRQGHRRKPYHQQQGYGDRAYPQDKHYTLLNEANVHVLQEIMAAGLANLPPARDK
ncbi:putative gag polyprotein, partial [Trifolium medium]|nr:putative gag polyprotein [Trifolium medium]